MDGLKLQRTWIGYSVTAGGHLFVAGTSSVWARVWNLDNPGHSFTFVSRSYSFGPGLGGSGGGGLVVIFNLGNPGNLEGASLGNGGWNFSLDIPATRITKYKQIYGAIKTAQSVYSVDGIMEFVQDVYKSVVLGQGAKIIMKDLTIGVSASLTNSYEGTIDVRQLWAPNGGYLENL